MKLKKETGSDWVAWYKTNGKADAVIIKNPTWKEYFKIKEVDSYVRGFYDHTTDDIWIWRGEVLHNFVKTYKKIPDDAWRFILETKKYTIFVEQHGKARMVNKLKELEPQAKEGKGWIN